MGAAGGGGDGGARGATVPKPAILARRRASARSTQRRLAEDEATWQKVAIVEAKLESSTVNAQKENYKMSKKVLKFIEQRLGQNQEMLSHFA